MATTACLSLLSVVAVSPQQVSSELSGEVVILNIGAGVYHGLETTGARVWQLIQQPIRVADIRDAIVREYDVDPAQCELDLLELLEDLLAHGLLAIHSQPHE